jgi:hypothetical protein
MNPSSNSRSAFINALDGFSNISTTTMPSSWRIRQQRAAHPTTSCFIAVDQRLTPSMSKPPVSSRIECSVVEIPEGFWPLAM